MMPFLAPPSSPASAKVNLDFKSSTALLCGVTQDIFLRGRDLDVAQKLLDQIKGRALLQKMRGKTSPQIVRREMLKSRCRSPARESFVDGLRREPSEFHLPSFDWTQERSRCIPSFSHPPIDDSSRSSIIEISETGAATFALHDQRVRSLLVVGQVKRDGLRPSQAPSVKQNHERRVARAGGTARAVASCDERGDLLSGENARGPDALPSADPAHGQDALEVVRAHPLRFQEPSPARNFSDGRNRRVNRRRSVTFPQHRAAQEFHLPGSEGIPVRIQSVSAKETSGSLQIDLHGALAAPRELIQIEEDGSQRRLRRKVAGRGSHEVQGPDVGVLFDGENPAHLCSFRPGGILQLERAANQPSERLSVKLHQSPRTLLNSGL
jgi:hypothetical protein